MAEEGMPKADARFKRLIMESRAVTPNLDLTADQTTDSINTSDKLNSSKKDPMKTEESLTSECLIRTNLKLWGVAIPAIASQLVIIMVETISMIFVG